MMAAAGMFHAGFLIDENGRVLRRAPLFRELGAISYGAGLFSPTVDAAEFGRRFHGHDERVDVESLRLTTELWERVVLDLLA